jgi:hypothetical protein
MKPHVSKYLTLTGLLVIIAAIILLSLIMLGHAHKSKISEEISETVYSDQDESYVEFTGDSIYKIKYDTIVRVWDNRSGEKISQFNVYVSGCPKYPEVKQIELAPSGKYLAFLDYYNIVSVYNIFSGECEGFNDYYFDQSSHIYFSDDLKYFLMVDYREATVDVLQCPNLEYIATGNMGYYRNNFYWENINGKLVFYYEVVDSLYRTIFPDDGHSDSLVFSKPINVGEVVRENNGDF